MVTMLYIIAPGLVYFITGSLYLLTIFTLIFLIGEKKNHAKFQ